MGLDIYVRWDGMTREERDAQITGFTDATEVGYLRFNWTGVAVCQQVARELNAPDPIGSLYPEWNGSNGEGLLVAGSALTRLAEAKQRLAAWVSPPRIELARFPDEDPEDLAAWFAQKIAGSIAMISFIEANQDKPGLRIEFN